MAEPAPTLEESRVLYALMGQVKALAPWEWMAETDLFGVQDPATAEVGFVSVMGTLGEHKAISVYPGAAGFYGFWGMQQAGDDLQPEDLLHVPQLQASLENRNALEKADRDRVRRLGLKFRGQQSWPLFRSFRPGYAPWFIVGAEARCLRYALEQLLEVAPRCQEDPALLTAPGAKRYLLRVPRQVEAGLVWFDQPMPVPRPPASEIAVEMDTALLEAARRMPKGRHQVEVDCFLLPTPVGEKGTRPHFPHMLMIVEGTVGMIVGNELLQPQPTLAEMWGAVPMAMLRQLASTGSLPRVIRVRSAVLHEVLAPVSKALGIKLKRSRQLPNIDDAKYELHRFMRR